MSVEFIGYVPSRHSSEIFPPAGAVVDRAYIEASARAHEAAGFDRALVAFHSTSPESLLIAAYAAWAAPALGVMIAHRPGFTTPTLAARQFATLDQLTGGRTAIHIISGGNDAEQRQDGDYLSHDERYARTDEYLDVLRAIWTSREPIDHVGHYYRFDRAFAEVKSVQQPHIPVFFGGSSDAAIAVAGKHADVYALWGEPLAEVRDTIARVRAAAAAYGRYPRFSVSFRPILGETEAKAWVRAEAILARVREVRASAGLGAPAKPANIGSQRLLAAAAQGRRLDKRLWTAVAAETGARGNTTALVGTPDQVADALLDYYELGVSTFLIRGFDPLADAAEYGRDLIPLTRKRVAERIRRSAHAAE
ncbi:MAG: LLM class flavin-dependent oxidoreductase [Xanthobacteraceae bacterium]|nr:LLM class flavin-dependent oxidoreductase [Xanthobacteraceae bacterium]MBV9630951.1 LLM class flavin-dependent oxidoreductase [Xanthobacteraceae bacterium]